MGSKKSLFVPLLFALVLILVFSLATVAADPGLSAEEQLGKSIFFDENLSIERNQSCASCHTPEWGWTGPDPDTNFHGAVYEGSIAGRFGNRKPPSAAYATQSPILFNDDGTWTGGNFWDGRATGEQLGNPAADQALGPFLNPAEQALPDSACVVYRICTGDYSDAAEDVWGLEACNINWPANVDKTCSKEGRAVKISDEDRARSNESYDLVGLTIASYEASDEVNAFSSKYDLTFRGLAKLDKEEQRGFALFRGKGLCHRCHISNGQEALFTDYTFDNLGVPKNPENPVYENDPGFIDLGLGGFLGDSAEYGKQKVPTLRNVDLRPSDDSVKDYAHNGYFKSLKGIVHFYNTRDVKDVCPGDFTEAEALAANCWPEPEVAANVNADELGDLGLTEDEEDAIVAFLKTLSDVIVP